MEKLKEVNEPTTETNEYKEFATAHRVQQMQTLLKKTASTLTDDGPDAALVVLLEGVGEPVKPPAAPTEPTLPLRLQLMYLRIEAEREFDQKYLEKCVPPIVEAVKKCAKEGGSEIHISTGTLRNYLSGGMYPKGVNWNIVACRIAAWFVRQGVTAEFNYNNHKDGELIVYIPKRT